MSKFDWNNNGKKDIFDRYMEIKVMSDESNNDDINVEDENVDDILEIDEDEYSWRENYDVDYDIDPEDYETEEEYLEALELVYSNKKVSEYKSTSENRQIITNNVQTYKYCKVILDSINKKYDYLCGNLEIKINDSVLVPFGKQNEHIKGSVVAVGECIESAFNTSIDNMKSVLKVLNTALSVEPKKENNNIMFEDENIRITLMKWANNVYLLNGRARAGTFLFENKSNQRICMYFKNISVSGFLIQEESISMTLSSNQKEIKEIPFVYDNKLPDRLKKYSEIEYRVCYGNINEGLSASININPPLTESDIIIWKV